MVVGKILNKKTNKSGWIHGVFLAGFCICMLFSSCASSKNLKSGKGENQETSLSTSDFLSSEKEKINKLKETDLLKALWKSYLISEYKLVDECKVLVLAKFNELYKEQNYSEAYKYYSAIQAFGWESDVETSKEEVFNSFTASIPGLKNIEENKDLYPKTIADCVEASVTVWVDKGIKVENGAGIADGVIGSGFFIDKAGYIITNHHVISDLVNPKYEGFSRLYVKLAGDSDTKIPAKVIGYDPIIDLALLKVEVDAPFVLQLGSSSDLSVGDKISAIGTPIGLEGTLTSGIISSVDRKLTTMGNVFQLDAAVNSGNSGGPLIDENKTVQAIVFAGMLRYQGLNFAIPVEYLKSELPFLYAGGELSHSWISAYGRTKRKGKDKVGLEVQYVMPGGTAKNSFLQEDDVIVELQGEKISSIEDFQNVTMRYEPGSVLFCKYIHEDDEKTTMLYLEERPKEPVKLIYQTDLIDHSFVPLFGMQLIPSSTISSKSYRIVKVLKGSAAEEYGFSENDQVTVRNIKMEKEADYAVAEIYAKRRKKGFLDINIMMATPVDSPYYF